MNSLVCSCVDVLEGVKEGRSNAGVGAAALQAVCHLFSWVPLQSQASHSALLALVFHFTCTPVSNISSTVGITLETLTV